MVTEEYYDQLTSQCERLLSENIKLKKELGQKHFFMEESGSDGSSDYFNDTTTTQSVDRAWNTELDKALENLSSDDESESGDESGDESDDESDEGSDESDDSGGVVGGGGAGGGPSASVAVPGDGGENAKKKRKVGDLV